MFRFPGDARKLRASEINRWNQFSDAQKRDELRRRGAATAKDYDPSSRIVFVLNTSDSDRQAFECMSVDGLLWDLEIDGTSGLVFNGVDADETKTPVILIEPIAKNSAGRAVISGPALALVSGGSGAFGQPDTSGILQPIGSQDVFLLTPPHATDTRLLPVLVGGQFTGGLAKTPGGGISAATGTGTVGDPYVWGSGTCTEVQESGVVGSTTFPIYNSVDSAIGGDEVIHFKWIGRKRFVDVEGC